MGPEGEMSMELPTSVILAQTSASGMTDGGHYHNRSETHETLAVRDIHIKTTVRYTSHPLEWKLLFFFKKENSKDGDDVETLEPSLVGIWNGAATVENDMAVPQQVQWNYRMSQQFYFYVSIQKELKAENQIDTCMPAFITALLTIAKR